MSRFLSFFVIRLTCHQQRCAFPWIPGMVPGTHMGTVVFPWFLFPSHSISCPPGGNWSTPVSKSRFFSRQKSKFDFSSQGSEKCWTMRGGTCDWRTWMRWGRGGQFRGTSSDSWPSWYDCCCKFATAVCSRKRLCCSHSYCSWVKKIPRATRCWT